MLAALPNEILAHLFSFLADTDLAQIRQVCHRFEDLAEDQMQTELNSKNDWRLPYIHREKKISSFNVLKMFQKLISKNEIFVNRKIVHDQGEFDSKYPSPIITENLLICQTKNENGKYWSLTRRKDQATATLVRAKNDQIAVWNWSIIIGRLSDDMIVFDIWNIPENGPIALDNPKVHSITPLKTPGHLHNFQVNGDFILLKYEPRDDWDGQEFELWQIKDESAQLIPLPNYIPFLSSSEQQKGDWECDWLLDPNPKAQFLVGIMSTKNAAHFAIVFAGLSSLQYLHRITLPDVDRYTISDCSLSVAGHFEELRSVLVVKSPSSRPYGYYASYGSNLYADTYSFDVSKESRTVYARLDSTWIDCCMSGAYLLPKDCRSKNPNKGGETIRRINWDGKEQMISTHFISFPHIQFNNVTLVKVTDTQVLWKVDDGSSTFILCDYLLNTFDSNLP